MNHLVGLVQFVENLEVAMEQFIIFKRIKPLQLDNDLTELLKCVSGQVFEHVQFAAFNVYL